MLIVNNISLGGATPKTLLHAEWSGAVHLADLVFPWFLFIVGFAVPIAESNRSEPISWPSRLRKVLSRTAVLVLLGMLIDSAVARQPIFGLGVLQIIGLAYGVGALLSQLSLLPRMVSAVLLLGAHWLIVRHLPVPGVGTGVVRESGNAIQYINDAYLSSIGLKGLVSILPTSAMVLIGSLFGEAIRSRIKPIQALGIFLLGGFSLVGIGLLWELDLPMNKPIWTGSYIMYAAGLAAAGFGTLYALADVLRQRWAVFPFRVAGSNPIVAYAAPILVKVLVLQQWRWPGNPSLTLEQGFQKTCSDASGALNGAWLYTACYLGFWWLVLLVLYQRKVFVRV